MSIVWSILLACACNAITIGIIAFGGAVLELFCDEEDKRKHQQQQPQDQYLVERRR